MQGLLPIQRRSFPWARFSEEGEGEEEEEEMLYDDANPTDPNFLREALSSLEFGRRAPLYCLILATKSDTAVANLVSRHRRELAELAGALWTFLYLRTIQSAKQMQPFDFDEHASRVQHLARLFRLRFQDLPTLLFFETLDSGEYVQVTLRGLGESQCIAVVRELADHLGPQPRPRPLALLRRLKLARRITRTKESLLRDASAIGRETAVRLIKDLVGF